MTDETHEISASDLIPDMMYDRWPDLIPINAVIIVDAMNQSSDRSMYVLNNGDCPPWVLQGMLNLVQADVRSAWESNGFRFDERLIDEEDDEG